MRAATDDLVARGILMRTPMYQGVIAEALLDLGKTSEAIKALKTALDLRSQTQENWYLPELLRIKARILVSRGNRGDAWRAIAEAEECAELAGAQSFKARILKDMVQMAEADQDHNAVSALRRSLEAIVNTEETRQDGAAGLLESARRLAPFAPLEIWPIGVLPGRSGLMPVNHATETF